MAGDANWRAFNHLRALENSRGNICEEFEMEEGQSSKGDFLVIH